MNNENDSIEIVISSDDPADLADDPIVKDEPEFKLTVRKLEMPVRPRGVLAE